MENTNASTVLLLFGAGSRYETPNIAGSSHLFEHLLFKGTKKRKTPKEIAEVVESKGGILNAYTDKESTGYWCKVPSTSYQEGIEVLIEDQLVFLSELGELSGQAAVNIKKRLNK